MSVSPLFPGLPKEWTETTGFLPKGNVPAFYRFFKKNLDGNLNAKTARALFIVHGVGEQSDRFTHFPHYLHTSFDAIGLIDLPGHGQSGGLRGHIENFDVFSEAVVTGFKFFSARMQETYGNLEYHWLGCSMGGLISARTMVRFPNLNLASVSLAEPQFGIAVQVPFLKEFFGTLLEPIIGKIPLKNEIDVGILTHDESVQKTYVENPLNHAFISPRLFIQMKKEMAELANLQKEFPYNLFLLVPLADQVVSWKATFSFFQQVHMKTGVLKSMTTFPEFYHEIFNEVDRARAFVAFEDWIQRISKIH